MKIVACVFLWKYTGKHELYIAHNLTTNFRKYLRRRDLGIHRRILRIIAFVHTFTQLNALQQHIIAFLTQQRFIIAPRRNRVFAPNIDLIIDAVVVDIMFMIGSRRCLFGVGPKQVFRYPMHIVAILPHFRRIVDNHAPIGLDRRKLRHILLVLLVRDMPVILATNNTISDNKRAIVLCVRLCAIKIAGKLSKMLINHHGDLFGIGTRTHRVEH
mmetsp:Transcript_16721/g.25891  ORF Transcript_16721/g.25891 Transcript_16721/m.25891 type:complete len:214 (-) Transcript_16721:544-1185(-)